MFSAKLLNPKLLFSTKKLLPKRNAISPHSKKVRNERLLKAINKFNRKPILEKNENYKALEKIVMDLQPNGFYAPLNPSPEVNPKYGIKRKNRSIKKLSLPSQLLEMQSPETWVHSCETGTPKINIMQLDQDLFSKKLRVDILHRNVMYHMARKRAGNAKQKNRSEVRGGGKKPWNQKKTGKARHGSRRSPIFIGGGRVFAKRPKDYSIGQQKKVRRLGLKIALSQKFNENNMIVVDRLPLSTEKVFRFLREMDALEVLMVGSDKEINDNLEFREAIISSEEFPDVHYIPTKRINVYALLRLRKVLFTKDALEELTEMRSKISEIKRYNLEVEENIRRMEKIPDAIFD